MQPKLRFPEFSGDWSITKLLDISSEKKFQNGVFNDPKKVGSGYKLINVLDMYSDPYITEETLSLLDLDTKEFQRNQVKYGDIFFTRSSLVKEGIAWNNVFLYSSEDVTYDGHLIKLTPDQNKYLPLFLHYNFRNQTSRKQLISVSKTGTMTTIGQNDLSDIDIFYPILQEQTKIADFLSAVDKKIILLEQQQKAWQTYKQGMMQKLFSGELRFKDEDGQDFPDWEEIQLKQFLIPTLRPIDKPSSSYLSLGLRSHFKGIFHKPNEDPNKNSMDILYEVKSGDFVINITFAWEGALAIAKDEDEGGLVSHRFPTYRINNDLVDTSFFKNIFTQKEFLYQLDLCSPGGAGRNRVLNKNQFLEISILLPTVIEQQKIGGSLQNLDLKIENVTEQLNQMREWKKGLLQQMFV